MTTRKWSIMALTVAACLACIGCGPKSQTPEESLREYELAQYNSIKNSRPPPSIIKADENSLRMRLLGLELVQKDLRLTEDQLGKLSDLYETHAPMVLKIQVKLSELCPQLRSPRSKEELPKKRFSREVSKAEEKRICALIRASNNETKEFQTEALAILTPDQMKRLKQIQIQTAIPGTLGHPEAITTLHLSEEQFEKIRTLSNQAYQKEVAEWTGLSNPDKKSVIEFLKTSYKDREETTNRVLDILTPEQRTELEKLTGKMLDLTQIHSKWIENTELYMNEELIPLIKKLPPNPFGKKP